MRDARGGYTLLSGNETGVLLLDFLCARRLANGTMPPHPVMVKTIVTTDMAQRVASHYGVETVNVLTGFKFIGEQIGLLEKAGRRGGLSLRHGGKLRLPVRRVCARQGRGECLAADL